MSFQFPIKALLEKYLRLGNDNTRQAGEIAQQLTALLRTQVQLPTSMWWFTFPLTPVPENLLQTPHKHKIKEILEINT